MQACLRGWTQIPLAICLERLQHKHNMKVLTATPGAYDALIAGGGPAGLAAAETLGRRSCSALVLEKNHEIGSPIRTSGGSFIDELEALAIPASLYHPISRVRFVSPNNAAVYDYSQPRMCVIDVRGVFQFLAAKAVEAGATLRVGTKA